MSQDRKTSLLAIAISASLILATGVQAADAGVKAGVGGKSVPMSTVPTKAFKGRELAKRARISLPEARAIALKMHPGTVTDEELEAERGGSGLRYSFDIKEARGTFEVGVDAATGKVLENKLEGLVHD